MRRFGRRAAAAATRGCAVQCRAASVDQPVPGGSGDRQMQSSWGLGEGAIVYDRPKGNYEELRVDGMTVFKGPNFTRTGEMFMWLEPDVGHIAGFGGSIAAGVYGAFAERHGSVAAAYFARTRNQLQVAPATATRSVNTAVARAIPTGRRLFLRSYVQHYYPGSRNITVFSEIVDPEPEGVGGPVACIRSVGNFYFLKDGHSFDDTHHKTHRGYVAFHPEMRVDDNGAQSGRRGR